MTMTKRSKKKRWASHIHSWLGLLSSVFIILLSVTGLLLSYPSLLNEKPASTQHPFSLHPHYISTTNDMLFVATRSALYISYNNGLHYSILGTPFSAASVIGIKQLGSDLFVACRNGLVFKSTVPEFLWTRLFLPDDIYDIHSLFIINNTVGLSSNNGMYYMDKDSNWILHTKNTSPPSLQALVKALHTGYYPFESLKTFFSLATLCLLLGIATGFYLYAKPFIKKIR